MKLGLSSSDTLELQPSEVPTSLHVCVFLSFFFILSCVKLFIVYILGNNEV